MAERMGDPTKPSTRSKFKSKSSRKSSKSKSKAPRSESSTPQTSATTTPASTPPRTTRAARRKAQEEEDLSIENPPSYHYILVQRYPEEAKKAAQRQALERAALERAEAERAVQRAHHFRQRGGDIHRHQMTWEEVEEYLKRKLSRSASVLSRHLGRVTSRSLESLSSSSNHSHDSFGSNSLADEEKFYYDDNEDNRSVGSQGSLGVLWNHMTCSGRETQAEDWIGIPPPLDESFDEGPATPVRASCSPFRQPPF